MSIERCAATSSVLGLLFSAFVLAGAESPLETTRYRGGRIFTGDVFVEATLCVAGATIVACDDEAGSVVNLEGGFVIPPFADAHTHHFDSPYTFAWHRSSFLEGGVFYAMTMTAPTLGVLQIRDQLSGPKNVDVATALGGITGPESHPAEIYEALALGIRSYEEQVERADEIQAGRRSADNAYFVVETVTDVQAKWPIILDNEPDFIKVFLRSSERYEEGFGKWGAGGGIDPDLLSVIRELFATAGLRLAVANSSLGDYRASVAAKADLVTTDTARMIFPDRQAACLEPGCEASLLVLGGNPLEDFSRIRDIRLRIKDGEVLTTEDIQGGNSADR